MMTDHDFKLLSEALAAAEATAQTLRQQLSEAQTAVGVMVEAIRFINRANEEGRGRRETPCTVCEGGLRYKYCPIHQAMAAIDNLPASITADLKRRNAMEEVVKAAKIPSARREIVLQAALKRLADIEKGRA